MVRMVADAVLIKGEEDIDGRGGSFGGILLGGSVEGGGEIGSKGRGEEGGDVVGGPGGAHAIGEAGWVVEDKDVGAIADAEEESGFFEFFAAGFTEAVGVTW